MAKPLIFNRDVEKVLGFLMACRLSIRIKIRNDLVEEQLQWVLSYVQGKSADIWKENIIKDLESGNLSYAMVEEFLSDLKQEFGRENNETMKVAELRKMEQRGKTIEKFIQEFRRTAKESRYEKRLLIEEFKRGMNRIIRRKLMKAE